MPSVADVEAYIREQARRRNIPEGIALGVAQRESGAKADSQGDYWVDFLHYPAGTQVIARTPKGVIVPAGTPGAVPTSFGPFQLRAGKKVTGYAEEAGLGDAAIAAGIDVTNPDTWKQQVDFALNWAVSRGTFAGTWSTAVGELAAHFTGQPVSSDPNPPSVPGAPMVPSMPEPGNPSGPGPAAAEPFHPIVVPDVLGGFADSLKGVADALGQLPAAITKPFVDTVNNAMSLAAYFGQINIYKRLGAVVLGVVLIAIGIVLFALSFVDKGSIPVPLPV